ncbi:hypothetical protein FKM82_006084 [Ascaphus truei]
MTARSSSSASFRSCMRRRSRALMFNRRAFCSLDFLPPPGAPGASALPPAGEPRSPALSSSQRPSLLSSSGLWSSPPLLSASRPAPSPYLAHMLAAASARESAVVPTTPTPTPPGEGWWCRSSSAAVAGSGPW